MVNVRQGPSAPPQTAQLHYRFLHANPSLPRNETRTIQLQVVSKCDSYWGRVCCLTTRLAWQHALIGYRSRPLGWRWTPGKQASHQKRSTWQRRCWSCSSTLAPISLYTVSHEEERNTRRDNYFIVQISSFHFSPFCAIIQCSVRSNTRPCTNAVVRTWCFITIV